MANPSEILSEFQTAERRAKFNRVLDRRVRGITIVLENLYDPHNISAVLRTAEALGIQDVYVVEASHAFKFSSGVTRGCEKWLSIRRFPSAAECAAALREAGYEICVADHRTGTKAVDALEPEKWRAYWMGAEHAGVSAEALALADSTFTIPMSGFSESFNVSVAAAMILFSARRRWESATGQQGDLTTEAREELATAWLRRDINSADAILDRYDVGDDRKSWRTPRAASLPQGPK